MFFDAEVTICERFTSLSPFDVRAQRANEVFLLIERINGYDKRNNGGSERTASRGGKTVIRRRAGDDWF